MESCFPRSFILIWRGVFLTSTYLKMILNMLFPSLFGLFCYTSCINSNTWPNSVFLPVATTIPSPRPNKIKIKLSFF
jgi:hypothetical protein